MSILQESSFFNLFPKFSIPKGDHITLQPPPDPHLLRPLPQVAHRQLGWPVPHQPPHRPPPLPLRLPAPRRRPGGEVLLHLHPLHTLRPRQVRAHPRRRRAAAHQGFRRLCMAPSVFAGAATRCVCMKGYVVRDGKRWAAGDWCAGCVRRVDLHCNNNSSYSSRSSTRGGGGGDDGSYGYGEVKLPDMGETVTAGDGKEGCERRCRNHCSCWAYAFDRGIGCLAWWTDLVDIQKFNGVGVL